MTHPQKPSILAAMRADTFDQNEFTQGLFSDLDEETNSCVSLPLPPPNRALMRQDSCIRPELDLWPPRLPMELALCETTEDAEEIVSRFGLSPADFERIKHLPEFRRAISEAQVVVRESGYGFKLKCRAIAEDFLGPLDQQLYRADVPLSQKLDIFKTVTRLGELEPKAKKEESTNQSQPTVNIQINL